MALYVYMSRTESVRLCDELFICFPGLVWGKALSKQRLSHWILEAISLAYDSKDVPLPQGISAYSTSAVATSWALFKGVSLGSFS